MARCVLAVVAFAEHPAVEGSRTLDAAVNLGGMKHERDRVPDIGLGPKALLMHAIDHPVAVLGPTPRPFTPLDSWLSVRLGASCFPLFSLRRTS